jgi:hypothetical protein
MSPGDGIGVSPADLVAHAGHVEAVADRVATAKQAGDAVRLDAAAYGRLCTIVPALMNGLQHLLIDAIDAAAGSLHDGGARLRTTAEGYRATDENAAARHQQVWGTR